MEQKERERVSDMHDAEDTVDGGVGADEEAMKKKKEEEEKESNDKENDKSVSNKKK
jgi:hypothetical protein